MLKEIFKTLNAMLVYSHSYWLADSENFCTTNNPVLARERWQNNENSLNKHIFLDHPLCRFVTASPQIAFSKSIAHW